MQEKYKYILPLNKSIKYKILELANLTENEYWVFVYSILYGDSLQKICDKLVIDKNRYATTKEIALAKFDLTYKFYEKYFIDYLQSEIDKNKKREEIEKITELC